MLTIRLLGPLEVRQGGERLALPRSKKTRALLAYLVATGRPHRRERLCSLLWEVPDDPRGALRWSLSKLRALVDEPGRTRLAADRESVAFLAEGAEVDLAALRDLAGRSLDQVPADRLQAVADGVAGEFLEGVDLPGQPDFQAWCVAEREEARRRHAAVLAALVARLAGEPEEALPHARRAVQLGPFDGEARVALVGLLARTDRRGEAEQHCEAGLRLLQEAGLPGGELARMARELRDPGFARRGDGTPPDPSGDERPSVAVLPLANLSRDPDQGHFGDGIADDLITDLAKISGLFVAARQSAFALKGAALDAREAGAKLGARYVLEGSVRRAGERVRITAQLVDAATGGHLWAERYDRVLTDVFAVQDDIVRHIVAALKVRLLPGEAEAIHQAPTGDLEAYQLYLRGRQLLLVRRDKPSQELARRLFAQAVALDPGFARAHAGVAECDANLHLHFGGRRPVEEILATAEAALALEPGLAAAHAARGVALVASGRLAEAEQAFGRAIALEPDNENAHHRYARLCVQQGRMEDAARLFRRAAELSPDDIFATVTLLGLERGLGRHEAARATARLLLGRARRELERHPENPYAAFAAASALATLGDREGAARLAERALALGPDDHPVQYNVACVHAALGEAERAIDLLERTMPDASAHRWTWLGRDPDLDALRGHPRFEALLRRDADP